MASGIFLRTRSTTSECLLGLSFSSSSSKRCSKHGRKLSARNRGGDGSGRTTSARWNAALSQERHSSPGVPLPAPFSGASGSRKTSLAQSSSAATPVLAQEGSCLDSATGEGPRCPFAGAPVVYPAALVLGSSVAGFLGSARHAAAVVVDVTRRPVAGVAAAATGGGSAPAAAAATPVSGAAAVVAAAVGDGCINLQRCAPVLEDSLLNNAAVWLLDKLIGTKQLPHGHHGHTHGHFDILERILPGKLHELIHAHERTTAIVLREILVGLIFALLFASVERVCRLLDWLWVHLLAHSDLVGTFSHSDDLGEVEEHKFEEGGFAAAVGPLKFLIVAFFVTRHARLLIPLLKMELRPVLVAKLRASAVTIAATGFAIGWKRRALAPIIRQHGQSRPILLTLTRFLSLFLRAVGAIVLLEVWGIHFRSLIAVGGVSGVAIGFASKELFSNFFGGLVLSLTQPFNVGHAIKAGNVSGVVKEIGFLQTKLEGFDLTPIVVPNSMFLSAVISNTSRSTGRVLDITLELPVKNLAIMKQVTSQLTEMLRKRPEVDPTRGACLAHLKAVGSFSIQLGITATLKKLPRQSFLAFQQELIEDVHVLILANGGELGGPGSSNTRLPSHGVAELSRK